MAKTLPITLKTCNMLSTFSINNSCRYGVPLIYSVRQLYSPSSLGIDGYLQARERAKLQFANMSEKFRTKMTEYVSNSDNKSIIFTEDLKNMVHLTESSKEDITLVKNMIRKFNQQNKELRFGNFVFGPVVMRMFHLLNAPDEALECFKSPEFEGFFDQLMSYQVLLDLLYENKRYDDVISTFDLIKSKQLQGTKYPKNVVVLAMAALYKQNTPESLNVALSLWNELQTVGHIPMRKATTFCAGLALNQGDPKGAFEIVSVTRNQGYITVRDIKAIALADMGRIEDAVSILKSVLQTDNPNNIKNTVTKDVVERVRAAVEKSDNVELKKQYSDIEKYIHAQEHVTDKTLDEQLCQNIVSVPHQPLREQQNQFKNISRNIYQGKRTNNYTVRDQRPGLQDMH